MVDFLTDEDEYWCKVVSDPWLWCKKTKNNTAAKEKHLWKRCCLVFYWNYSEDVDHQSENLSLWWVLGEDNNNGHENEDVDNLISDVDPLYQFNYPHKKDGYKKCGQAKTMNKVCFLLVCKACCSDSTEECKLTDHKHSKKHTSIPYFQSSLTNPSIVVLNVSDFVQVKVSGVICKEAIENNLLISSLARYKSQWLDLVRLVWMHALFVRDVHRQLVLDSQVDFFHNF